MWLFSYFFDFSKWLFLSKDIYLFIYLYIIKMVVSCESEAKKSSCEVFFFSKVSFRA